MNNHSTREVCGVSEDQVITRVVGRLTARLLLIARFWGSRPMRPRVFRGCFRASVIKIQFGFTFHFLKKGHTPTAITTQSVKDLVQGAIISFIDVVRDNTIKEKW